MVRCQNAARAGPFGGVVPVQMPAAGAASNTTATATEPAAAAGAETTGAAAAEKSGTADAVAGTTGQPAATAAEEAADAQKRSTKRGVKASRIMQRSANGMAYRKFRA
jgi:hypothetical protein